MSRLAPRPPRNGLHLGTLFYVVSCACVFTATAPSASAQFKAWVMAKLPDTPEG
jgi:hypothetical protein